MENISLYGQSQNIHFHFFKSLLIQRRRRKFYLNKITAVLGFQRLVWLSVYRMSESVKKKYGCYRSSGIDSSSQLNNHTDHLKTEHLDTIFLATFVQYCSTQLMHQTKAWLKWWSFQCVVLSECTQLNTHHWNLSSRSLRPICRNVCMCVHVSVCVPP